MTGINIETKKLQTAIFIKKPLLLNGKDKYSLILDLQGDEDVSTIFDGEPTVIPIPDDSPFDIPRLILKSKSEIFSSNISPIRVDIFSDFSKIDSDKENNGGKTSTKKFEDQIRNSMAILNKLIKDNESVYRIGFSVILEISQIEDIDFIKKIESSYLKDKTEELKEISLTLNRRGEFNNVPLNNIVNIYSNKKELMALTIDINTATEDSFSFDLSYLNDFMENCVNVINDKINNIVDCVI